MASWMLSGLSLPGPPGNHKPVVPQRGAVCSPRVFGQSVSPPSDRAVGLQAWTPGRGFFLLHQKSLQGQEVSPSWPQGRTTPPFRPQDTDVSHPQTPGRHNDPLRQGPQPHQSPLEGSPSLLDAGQASLPHVDLEATLIQDVAVLGSEVELVSTWSGLGCSFGVGGDGLDQACLTSS